MSFRHSFKSIKAILVTESLASDIIGLKPVFQQIYNILGYFPVDSIIVLGTKRNVIQKEFADIRIAGIKKIMDEFKIPQHRYLEFYTPCAIYKESEINSQQYADLSKLILECAPVKLDSINEKRNKIC